MFYDKFRQLCESKGVSCNRAALEIGLSNATVPKWKRTGATPSGDTLNRVAAYFGVSVDYLLNKEIKKSPSEGELTEGNDKNIIRIAGRDGSYVEKRLTDEQLAAVKTLISQLPDADF